MPRVPLHQTKWFIIAMPLTFKVFHCILVEWAVCIHKYVRLNEKHTYKDKISSRIGKKESNEIIKNESMYYYQNKVVPSTVNDISWLTQAKTRNSFSKCIYSGCTRNTAAVRKGFRCFLTTRVNDEQRDNS